MSLVNNSANNFKDFLDAIKPYLNYQFYDLSGQGVEANNFSTDEKVIGTWIDGKPLYQKSLYTGYLSEKDTTVNVEALSIDKVINMFGMIFNSNGEMMPVPNCEPNGNEWGFGCSYIGQSNVVRVRRNAMENPSTSYSYITIRYTKTTDTAVASGEKIVGQWIDGSPIYQKIVDFGTLPNTTTKEVNTGITNAKDLLNAFGFGYNSDHTAKTTIPRIRKDNRDIFLTFNSDLTKINILTENDRTSISAYITIQYTKVS